MIHQLVQTSRNRPLKMYHSTKDWSADYFLFTKDKTPVDKAILGGFTCRQFSFAFMAGYQAALAKMFPTIAPDQFKALCISETGGVHPKSIKTRLVGNQVTGIKTYVTGGSEATHLLVLCKVGENSYGRPILKMIQLPGNANNIEITDFNLSFMQEVKHGKLSLKGSQIKSDQILEGDGYSHYAKPFRTLEDICISAAYQAMLLRQALDNNWSDTLRDQILFNLFTLKNLILLPLLGNETHILLSAYEINFENLLPDIDLHITNHSSSAFRADWETNKKAIFLGKKTKEQRLLSARKILFE